MRAFITMFILGVFLLTSLYLILGCAALELLPPAGSIPNRPISVETTPAPPPIFGGPVRYEPRSRR
jgi:hypothetical protein